MFIANSTCKFIKHLFTCKIFSNIVINKQCEVFLIFSHNTHLQRFNYLINIDCLPIWGIYPQQENNKNIYCEFQAVRKRKNLTSF